MSRLTRGIAPGYIIERFGPLSFDVALSVNEEILRWDAVSWRVGRIKLPRTLMPVAFAEETEDANGHFHFDVAVHLPLGLGRVVHYRGSLAVQDVEPTLACRNIRFEPDHV